MLKWALLGPFAIWAIALLLGVVRGPGNSEPMRWLILAAVVGAAVVQIVAVAVAVFLLVRAGPYVTAMNVVMTVVAAVPVLLFVFVGLALVGPNARLHV